MIGIISSQILHWINLYWGWPEGYVWPNIVTIPISLFAGFYWESKRIMRHQTKLHNSHILKIEEHHEAILGKLQEHINQLMEKMDDKI